MLGKTTLEYLLSIPQYPGAMCGNTDPLCGQVWGIRNSIVKIPSCSLLMSANIIYNHASTERGYFYHREGVGLSLIEEIKIM